MTNPNDVVNATDEFVPIQNLAGAIELQTSDGTVRFERIKVTRGLTKREYFAAMRKDPIYGDAALPLSIAVSIMGDNPPNDYLENVKWWIMATEKFAVMRADALINALNQQ